MIILRSLSAHSKLKDALLEYESVMNQIAVDFPKRLYIDHESYVKIFKEESGWAKLKSGGHLYTIYPLYETDQ